MASRMRKMTARPLRFQPHPSWDGGPASRLRDMKAFGDSSDVIVSFKPLKIVCYNDSSGKDSVEWSGSEENEPQINADERRFVISNPSLFIGSLRF